MSPSHAPRVPATPRKSESERAGPARGSRSPRPPSVALPGLLEPLDTLPGVDNPTPRRTQFASCNDCFGGGQQCSCPTGTPSARISAKSASRDAAEHEADSRGAEIARALPSATTVRSGPLAAPMRAVAEAHLATPLADVQVRADPSADRRVRQERALAMTEGTTVSFAAHGITTDQSRRYLLGHELVHVAQQRSGGHSRIQRKDDDGGVSLPEGASASGQGPAEKNKSEMPAGNTVGYRGFTLVADEEYLEARLEDVAEGAGKLSAAKDFVKGFELEFDVGSPSTAPGGTGGHGGTDKDGTGGGEGSGAKAKVSAADQETAKGIAPKLRTALTRFEAAQKVFRESFVKRAEQVLFGLLDASEKRVLEERDKYGLKRVPLGPGTGGGEGTGGTGGTGGAGGGHEGSGSGSPDEPTRPEMDDNVRTAGLRAAARELAEKQKRITQLKVDQSEYAPPKPAKPAQTTADAEQAAMNAAEYNRIGEQIKREVLALQILRDVYESKYPILASFTARPDASYATKEEKLAQLNQVGSSETSSSDVAGLLLAQIDERLENIAKVREAVGGELSIWKLPRVVAITLAEQQHAKGSWQSILAKESMEDAQGGLAALAIAVLSIVVGVALAKFTGGGSLAVGIKVAVGATMIAIDVAQVLKDVEEYKLSAAAANTDFDIAQAVAQEDPSLFWLAISVASLGFNIGDVRDIFRTLRGPVSRLVRASASEVPDAAAAVRKAAGGTKAGRKIGDDIVRQAKQLNQAVDGRAAHEVLGGAKGYESEAIQKAAKESATESKHLPSKALSDVQVEAELEYLSRSGQLTGPVGARVGHIGEHVWREQGPGQWCRYSLAKLCLYLGEGPEVDALRVTGKVGAGMKRKPRHHIFPQEYREYFESRGFRDIDGYTVELEEAVHQALHGGGNWRLGRTWPGEWNTRIISELVRQENRLNRNLTRAEIIQTGQRLMAEYQITGPFVSYR